MRTDAVAGLSLFMVQRRTTPEGRVLDTIRASLSTSEEYEFTEDLRDLRSWHRRMFPTVLLAVTDPYADAVLRRRSMD